MMRLEDLGDTEKNLIDRPFTSYFLNKLYDTKFDFNLPSFIVRKDEIIDLKKMGLVEQISKTHTHYKPTKLTKLGLNICESLENSAIFKIFKDIPLQNKQKFLEFYNSELDNLKKYSNSIFYESIKQNIGDLNSWKSFKKINIMFREFILIFIDAKNEVWKFEYILKCVFCNKPVEQSIEIKYDINNFENFPKKFNCESCGSEYMLCPLINCLYAK